MIGALPAALPLWLVAAGLGGALGATLGSRHLPERALRLLALVLRLSGARLVLPSASLTTMYMECA